MKKQTLEQIKDSVALLENSIRFYGEEDEETDLEAAVNYVYRMFMESQDDTNGYDRSVRFDGKPAIITEIIKQIQESEYIKLKQ